MYILKKADWSKVAGTAFIDPDNLTEWDILSDKTKKKLGSEANMKSWNPNIGRKPRKYKGK